MSKLLINDQGFERFVNNTISLGALKDKDDKGHKSLEYCCLLLYLRMFLTLNRTVVYLSLLRHGISTLVLPSLGVTISYFTQQFSRSTADYSVLG